MIIVTVKMTVLPTKRREFLQTTQALVQSIRKISGCLKCFACQDIEDENTFCMIEDWDSQIELDSYLQSDLFKVLLGTKNFLSQPWEIYFYTVSFTTRFEGEKNTREHKLILGRV